MKKLLFIVLAGLPLTSCHVKYNNTEFDDPNEGNKMIYGTYEESLEIQKTVR